MTARETALIMLVGVAAFWYHGCDARRQGELRNEIKRLKEKVQVGESAVALLLNRKPQVDTVRLKARTVFLGAKAVYDTAPTPQNAEKVINACIKLDRSCAEQAANDAGIIKGLLGVVADKDAIIDLQDKERPKRIGLGCSGPLVAATKGFDLGVACGGNIRF